MNIAVIGVGYVGLVSGACFAEFGTRVTCVDIDEQKIKDLEQGKIPIYEPGLDDLVERNAKAGRLHFTTDLESAVKENLVIFICVGTPQDPYGRADLKYVMAAAEQIAGAMNGYKVIVIKSTVPVGTGDNVETVIRDKTGGRYPFSVASNPEFLREGAAIDDFMRPDRVVIGTEDKQSAAILHDLYQPLNLIDTPILSTRRRTAELVKYAANAFLAVKISYINEMADLCEKVGADVHDIARGMGLDRRIGRLFLHPGPGYGGSCFPKDTLAVVATGKEHGKPLEIIGAAVSVNADRCQQMVEKIVAALDGDVSGRCIAMLGLAFKPNTDDVRESPAIAIARQLLERGATIRAYDPVANERARQEGLECDYCDDEYDACKGADALVLATEWNQFRSLDLDNIKKLMNAPVLVDLRNVYEPDDMREAGFRYSAVGRLGA